MKKKILCMALVGAMAFSMAACGGKEGEGDLTPTPSAAPTEEAGKKFGNTIILRLLSDLLFMLNIEDPTCKKNLCL